MKPTNGRASIAAWSAVAVAMALASPGLAQEMDYWNGAYTGVTAGYAFGKSPASLDVRYFGETTFSPRQNIEGINASGFIGGVTVGYNYTTGPFVFGVEGDLSLLAAKGMDADEFTFPLFQNEIGTEYHWLGTLRGRAGVANGKWLAYGTGGLAVGGFEDFITGTDLIDGPIGDKFGSKSTKTGYVLGAGAEYALTERISLKAEYLFANLGKTTVDVNQAADDEWFGPDTSSFVNASHQLNIVRVGVNFQF